MLENILPYFSVLRLWCYLPLKRRKHWIGQRQKESTHVTLRMRPRPSSYEGMVAAEGLFPQVGSHQDFGPWTIRNTHFASDFPVNTSWV